MKRFLIKTLTISILLALFPMGMLSVSAKSNGTYKYVIENEEVAITDYIGYGGDVIIPSAIEGYPVTSISSVAFSGTKILSVVIPDSVLFIGDGAFQYCTSLTTVDLGVSISTIGKRAFERCDSLNCVVIGDSVTAIGTGAFESCLNLTLVVIGNGLSVIDEYTFSGCSNLTTVIFGNSISKICGSAFQNCRNLSSIGINLGVSSVGWGAFNKCTGLSTVYYTGSQEDRKKIEITSLNSCLTNATWQYDVQIEAGHIFDDVCDAGCNVCEFVRNAPHDYFDPSCVDAKICKICSFEDGEPLGHTWLSATCTTPATCTVCGASEGEALGHTSDAGTVTKKATCKATGVRTYKCTVCGEILKTETIAKKAHTYAAATCIKAKTCKVCGVTSGKKLGHKYTNACDTSCNTCKATRKITHSYKTVTKKATTTANGFTVKRCSVCDKETGKTTIYKASKITLSATSYTYNGKTQKPTVTVKDSKGNKIATSNYTVTYASGRKNVGTYKVTIKFKGKYSGTKTLTYTINPVKTTVSKLTAAKKSLKVTITKKSTQVTGYEVQYSTSKSFKTAKTKTLTSYKKNTLTLSNLTAQKTYYVRVRTYKTVNGKKVYSAWSTAKSMKTK